MEWTNQVVERMATLADAGNTAAEIAAVLSNEYRSRVSRNAVVGKLARSGIRLKSVRANPRPNTGTANRPVVKRRPRPRAKWGLVLEPSLNPPQKIAAGKVALTVTESLRPSVTFAELQLHHCRWPIGEPGQPGFGFCGCRRTDDRPYCEVHNAKALGQP